MKPNPTLKNALIRTGYIVGSLAAYIIIMRYLGHLEFEADLEWKFSLYAIVRFVVPLLLVWLNVRKLAKPVRLGFMALFVLAYTSVIFTRKVEPTMWNRYYTALYIVGLAFVTLATLLPIWLRNVQAKRLSKCSKVLMWAAVLLMDFAVAMPEIWYYDSWTDGVYVGSNIVDKSASHSMKLPVYGFASETLWDVLGSVDVNVMTPDSLGTYTSRVYRHAWETNYMVDTLARDTIWIYEYDTRYDPDRKTMTNIELMHLHRQWQYRMWHRLKRMFNKK